MRRCSVSAKVDAHRPKSWLESPLQILPSDMNKLTHFPIALFGTVMGLGGLTLAWSKAAAMGWSFGTPVAWSLAWITSLLLITLILTYGLKLMVHTSAVVAEARHPVKLNFFSAIPIGIVLVATIWSSTQPALANVIWILGSILMLVSSLLTLNSWLNHTHYQINHLNPAWFIPVVGNILIPIAGARLGHLEVSWFFFSIGLFFWIVLTIIVINRLIFHDTLQPRMKPTLFILLAPPAVGFISYLALNGAQLDTLARVLFFTALFVALLLLINIPGLIKVPFFLSSWAYTFPLAAMSIASFEMGQISALFGYIALAWALLAALSVLSVFLIYKTTAGLLSGKLLAPEPA
jgi:tellurite resistance protein